jgi:predicted lipoprotein with Yx(FWY)xxD motif
MLSGRPAGNVLGTAAVRRVLVDPEGRALYVSTSDPPASSQCLDQCALTWPPLVLVGADGRPAR